MTRPRLVRADTLDLQDHDAPSAQDHKQDIHTNEGTGLAPHQEKELRLAGHDSKTEIMNGPDGRGSAADGYHDGIDIYDGSKTDDIHIGLGVHQDEGDAMEGEDEDHSDDGEDDDLLDDELMDKISSSPSIDDDDINFEFVYALHNFVATVDGQANASKGDNMVLLDDSNSYWWLVRIVKDGSIGYLPAEHIETPTERLARLNKHRNVDLSATMLGDNLEKSKNPLKKAMRRRNAKTVAFTSPTYIEASDVDYSTEEEDDDDDVSFTDEYAREEYEQQEDRDEDIVVEPLRPKSQKDKGSEETPNTIEEEPGSASPDKQRSSQEIFEQDDTISPTSELTVNRSRNGTLRNTDSFFKDDTVETKKISLTPNILRDESASNEPREPRISFEALDKINSNEKKEDKKRKDKKPGMLSGLFKRKDKKSKSGDDDGEDLEKVSGELSRSSPTPKTSSESVSSPEARPVKHVTPPRQTSKLQKQQSEAASARETKESAEAPAQKERPTREQSRPDQTIRQVVLDEVEEIAGSSRPKPENNAPNTVRIPSPSKKPSSPTSPTSPISPMSPMSPIGANDRQIPPSQGTYSRSVTSPPQKFSGPQGPEYQTRFMESPVNASPVDRQRSPSVPGLTTDLPASDQAPSPDSPPLSPAETADSRRAEAAQFEAPTPTWSDASLRSYLEDENELRDLYVIVYDNTNIPPAGPEHPITGNLFKHESKRLREMNSQLDSLLSDWVTQRVRKSASQ
ncbi:hypothetical protein BDV18DRAFT_80773 [Aspergillus unguis]